MVVVEEQWQSGVVVLLDVVVVVELDVEVVVELEVVVVLQLSSANVQYSLAELHIHLHRAAHGPSVLVVVVSVVGGVPSTSTTISSMYMSPKLSCVQGVGTQAGI